MVGINDNQAFGNIVPCDEVNVGIVQSVYLVEGLNAVVLFIVSIEVVRCKYVKHIATLLYPLHIAVCQKVFPRSYATAETAERKYGKQAREYKYICSFYHFLIEL